jgi:uncharacterized protein YggU (UPF0235/DUF167 family)
VTLRASDVGAVQGLIAVVVPAHSRREYEGWIMSGIAGDLFDIETDATGDEPPVIVLRVRLRAGAGATKVAGRDGTTLGVQCATPHATARANSECVALIAEALGVEEGAVKIAAGEKLREKRFRIAGVDIDDARRRIESVIEEAVGRGRRSGR